MRTITITISVPEGVEFRVHPGPPPDDFENEPLPLDTFATDESSFGPSNGHVQSEAYRQHAAPAAVAPARIWNIGDVHVAGHKPLKGNSRGLFCPTSIGKGPDGKTMFCSWRP